jgi:hypothetical protein
MHLKKNTLSDVFEHKLVFPPQNLFFWGMAPSPNKFWGERKLWGWNFHILPSGRNHVTLTIPYLMLPQNPPTTPPDCVIPVTIGHLLSMSPTSPYINFVNISLKS